METKKNKDLRPGVNPATDIAVFKKEKNIIQVLLVTRGKKSAEESGKLALPGGFQDTNQSIENEWREDKETAKEGATRELLEETTLNIFSIYEQIKYVGTYDGVINKKFDSSSWIITNLFTVLIPEDFNFFVIGSDDAEHADWYDLNFALMQNLAFDHKQKIIDSIKKLNLR